MVSKVRAQRIADRIREDIAEIILTQSVDPRLAGVTVTDVQVDRELDYANIYVSAVEGSERAEEILTGLSHAQGFLRSELARRIQLRSFPRLRFHWDHTFERAETMERLFASLKEEEKRRTESGSSDEHQDQASSGASGGAPEEDNSETEMDE